MRTICHDVSSLGVAERAFWLNENIFSSLCLYTTRNTVFLYLFAIWVYHNHVYHPPEKSPLFQIGAIKCSIKQFPVVVNILPCFTHICTDQRVQRTTGRAARGAGDWQRATCFLGCLCGLVWTMPPGGVTCWIPSGCVKIAIEHGHSYHL